jgi:hypothetical protein
MERAALEYLLREALSRIDSADGEIAPNIRAALADVARRFRGAALSLTPVVVEVVEAVLRELYAEGRKALRRDGTEPSGASSSGAAAVPSTESWHKMSMSIAQSLYDDPSAHERLQSLWAHLSEG